MKFNMLSSVDLVRFIHPSVKNFLVDNVCKPGHVAQKVGCGTSVLDHYRFKTPA